MMGVSTFFGLMSGFPSGTPSLGGCRAVGDRSSLCIGTMSLLSLKSDSSPSSDSSPPSLGLSRRCRRFWNQICTERGVMPSSFESA